MLTSDTSVYPKARGREESQRSTFTVLIPSWHPATVNKLLSGHWSKAHKIKKSDRAIIAHYFRGKRQAEGKRAVLITITLKKGKRAADPDAYYKSVLDALVHAGMLVDDNRYGIELLPIQFERGTESRWGTSITIMERV